MNLLWFLPLVVVVFALFVWFGGKSSRQVEHALNSSSRVLFDRFVSENSDRRRRIEAAYIETTYRTYATRTILYALLALVAGSVAGAYLIAGLLLVLEPIIQALAGLPRTITAPLGIRSDFKLQLAARTRWLIILIGGLSIGVVAGVLSYVMRWRLPASNAEVRRRGINEGLTRTTAFMFALSRGGLEFPQILRKLTDHRKVYGQTANEFSVAVREMDLFGRDMITALRRMSRRTPSEQFNTFSENLTSVLQSGSDLPDFLSEQYERFRDEAKNRQNEVLESLGALAEGYVTIFVAGMLFLITILLVFGLTTTDTLFFLQLLIYAVIPLANAGFGLFLAQKLDALGIAYQSGGGVLGRMSAGTPTRSTPATAAGRPDGGRTYSGAVDNWRMLALYDRVRTVKEALRSPYRILLWNPQKILWVTVPIALLAFAVRAPAAFAADGVSIRVLDDLLIQSVLFVLISYAIVRQLYRRRINRVEAATPELLERLASLNEAGMSLAEGLDRVRGSDLGVLSPEVERVWRDVEYGSTIDDALVRFGRRIRTTAITRVVTLLTNAMRASGEMAPVLRVASEQARSEVQLRRQRRQQMLTYLIVIYISFFVFLVIIVAVNEVLVPSLPDTVPGAQDSTAGRIGAQPDTFTRFGDVSKAAYTLIFFHAALIQAVCAGFIGGQLGEGSLRDGAKHAAIMLTIAYVAFLLLSSPVASISMQSNPATTGESITVQSVSLSQGGFVAVFDEDGTNGTLLGHSEYLPAGSHSDVVVTLDEQINSDRTIRIVPHKDTNGNEQFDFQRPGSGQVDRPYSTVSDGGIPGIEVSVTHIEL